MNMNMNMNMHMNMIVNELLLLLPLIYIVIMFLNVKCFIYFSERCYENIGPVTILTNCKFFELLDQNKNKKRQHSKRDTPVREV